MTESEWEGSTDPTPMLDCLGGHASDRKLILFCLYWCPIYAREWANGDPAYSAAMQFAEAGDNLTDLRLAWLSEEAEAEGERSLPERPLSWARLLTEPTVREIFEVPPARQAPSILREIFGNPFRSTAIDHAWLVPAVTSLAQVIYDEWAFDRMPELAEALQSVGCQEFSILDHCRTPARHVRGCWVVDLLLGKK